MSAFSASMSSLNHLRACSINGNRIICYFPITVYHNSTTGKPISAEKNEAIEFGEEY